MTHPDDIGYDRAEARQQAAEDGVQWHDDEDSAYADICYEVLSEYHALYERLMDAALDERFGLPAWEDARERAREAMPVPGGLSGEPF